MNARYRLLAQRIRDEVAEIEQTISAVSRHWKRFQRAKVDQDAYLNSVALNLHGFYSGVERVLELIALELMARLRLDALHRIMDVPSWRDAGWRDVAR